MFPRPEHPSTPVHGWLSTLRHGLDLIVAFATLRDVDTSPEAGWRDADAPFDHASSTRSVVAVPPATAAAKSLQIGRGSRSDRGFVAALADAEPAARAGSGASAAGTIGRAVERASAPDAAHSRASRTEHRGEPVPARSPHPHRRPLSAAPRTRRPGTVRPEPQLCLTPLAARRTRPTPAPARGARH
jgi:hypothetical protein